MCQKHSVLIQNIFKFISLGVNVYNPGSQLSMFRTCKNKIGRIFMQFKWYKISNLVIT